MSYKQDIKLHYFEDGHFWYEGSPLSLIASSDGIAELLPKKAKVRFSTSPIRHFSTFSNDDYDRRNDEIDPATATAEYEMEKRLQSCNKDFMHILDRIDCY